MFRAQHQLLLSKLTKTGKLTLGISGNVTEPMFECYNQSNRPDTWSCWDVVVATQSLQIFCSQISFRCPNCVSPRRAAAA